MKKFSIVAGIIAIIMVVSCAKNQANKKLLQLADEIINEYFKFHPVQATLLGKHDFDRQVDNWDKNHINKRINQLLEFQRRLNRIDSTLLIEQNKIDYAILQQQLRSEMWELKIDRPWENDATFYNTILKQAIIGITLHKHFSINQQCQSLSARLQQFPRFLQQAKQNLKVPYRLSIKHAVEQILSLNYLLTSETTRIASRCDSLLFYHKIVVDSLNNYRNLLEKVLLPISKNEGPTGKGRYLEILKNRYQIDVTVDEIMASAEKEHRWCHQQILNTSKKLFENLFPKESLNKPFEIQNIEKVLDVIYNNYPQNELLIEYTNEIIENIERFIITKDIFDLPAIDTLYVERTPGWDDSFDLVYLFAAGPFEKKQAHFYFLKSLPMELNWLDQISFLKKFNKSTLQVLTIHHVFPGRLLQISQVNHHASIVRKIFYDKNFIAGWPLMAGFLMIDEGYGGYDLKIKLVHLLNYLQTVISTIVDVKYNLGQLTEADAFAMLTKEGLMDSELAENTLARIKLNPAQNLSSFWGYHQLKEIYQTMQLLKGDYFSHSMFWKELLTEGAIPLPMLRNKLIHGIQNNP